ncbi:MAG: hypothetical protein HETSPECPRED_007720 [Heterodermia speciosa]|uniref:WSC domain-containing protein n=1 Tax=Heterodermia speciosa TaxID=116794 RepID=A0A8H3FVI2_9LECA|nr:MAG: hypothetical protein HETSPECPRED_007720 [Heterodermia speciosa]
MYKYGGGTGTTPTSSSSTNTPTSTGTGSATSLPSGWAYKGCYVDNANGRILNTQKPDSQTLTIESCVAACVASGYKVAGMEYSTQCFCGNSITNGGVLANAETDCNTACAGNNKEQCGGGNRMSIYARGDLAVSAPPAAQKAGLPGSWTYKGCITEGTNNNKVWKYKIINSAGNTATSCLTQCSNFGFMAGGVEYGEECYCGDIDEIAAAGSTAAPESDCNTACSGNSDYLCGGGNRLSWYQWTGTPLYIWSYPKGNAAGAYQQLIGGVCIPLLTTPGVNGKYQFVEKYGTGEPNSTGAYELDLTYINDVTKAWRPMHVKTDVFCSASITLPDKVGRQINIGGWSGDSLFGIRIYWPDGSPGVASTNDWQENVNELKLQIGRWYPSAMVMTNGSILVVGGENGSNGPPQPSLELLPTPAGGSTVVTLDFLQRTDPYNLYPFLFVVPSGIVIGYYNEMRILDPVTFATTKQLPNMPGNVNNPAAGRTYPLEGTAMLLPQYAPFNDPVTVLICGGSTNGAGTATDNCISTQPEAANPQWTLERMPSQRVISCMTALPDGTYMILNGAHQGVAGFGLATSPNLNAVLYDPSKPVNQRMSVMANTTVARLYHSEAILMHDGRVMVSGSDPQDGKNPEEYRVEVFIPPYRMPGTPAPPTFTVANKDWAYGQAITVQITSGALANPRASLMGAESSTHGNSMGQRTLFPAISCAGTTCTITAPPNKGVCPMGWFQLFILDGPTPSYSTFVRIGGDPGKLGNWPAFSDFKTPGI